MRRPCQPPCVDPSTGDTLTTIRVSDLELGDTVQMGEYRHKVATLHASPRTTFVYMRTAQGRQFPLDSKYGQVIVVTPARGVT